MTAAPRFPAGKSAERALVLLRIQATPNMSLIPPRRVMSNCRSCAFFPMKEMRLRKEDLGFWKQTTRMKPGAS